MKSFFVIILALLLTAPALSQDEALPPSQRRSWDVFLRRGGGDPPQTELIFIDLLSGDQSSARAAGERFTLTESGVIFYESATRKVKLAKADGLIRDHPFINLTAQTQSVAWAVSDDKERIAWSISRGVDDGALATAVWLADVAGAEIRELLVYGPRDGIRLLPIGFGAEADEIIMEAQAGGMVDSGLYTRRTGLFALAILEGELVTRALPGDQSCYCAVAFGANLMLRLAPNRESGGLDVEIHPLDGGDKQVIPTLTRGNYSEGGNIIISDDGKQALYALSQVSKGAGERDEIRTVLVHVDIENGGQRILSGPIAGAVRPLGFSEESGTALLALEQSGSTAKIDLAEGALLNVADAVYLGRIDDH